MADPLSITASAVTVATLAGAVLKGVRDLQEDQTIAEKLARETRMVLHQLTLVLKLIKEKVDEVNSNERIPQEKKIAWNESAKETVKAFEENCKELKWYVIDPKSGIGKPGWRKKLEKEVEKTLKSVDRQIGIMNIIIKLIPAEDEPQQSHTSSERTQTADDDISSLLAISRTFHTENVDEIVANFIDQARERHDSPQDGDGNGEETLTIELIKAIKSRNAEKVTELVSNGADVTAISDGWTAMHYCANEGSVSVLQAILQAYENQKDNILNIKTRYNGATPLHTAAANDKDKFARLALEHGANLYAFDGDESTPYDLAVEHNSFDFQKMAREADENVKEDHERRKKENKDKDKK